MGLSTTEIADDRAQTDASLGAERATFDADNLAFPAAERRLLDDLIERDRVLADLRLLKFRDKVDRTVSRERFDAPQPDPSIASERDSADQRSKVEREMSDSLLLGERQRSDIAIAAERNDRDALRGALAALRQNTDDQLSTERNGADNTTTALDATKDALEQATSQGERRHQVLGVVAHDLRSPLSVISLSAENIEHVSQESDVRSSCRAISLAVARMDRLLTDLLDLARIDSGTLRIVRRRHDVGALLMEVQRSYEPLFTARGIAFVVIEPPDAIVATFDYDRIVQVLSNLLGNAMKFTQEGGAVTLRCEQQTGQILFTLCDNGPGMSPNTLKHVFERFWQIDSLTRRGLGLGLHICENIVQAHGSRIWAESDVGHGATFCFTLPVA